MSSLELSVPHEARGERLDRFLAGAVADMSRTRLARLIDEGRVTVDGSAAKASWKLAGGERVRVEAPPPDPAGLRPEAIPLAILHEDDDIIAVDKPAGLVVHPGAGARESTLVHALLHHCGDELLRVGGPGRPGLVHRLDKDTTGVLVAAKTPSAYASLTQQFAARTVRKTYLAIVYGVPAGEGVVDAPIARSSRTRTRMAVSPRGKRAVSSWRVVERFSRSAALIEIDLRTGRTHQARVHVAHAGHAVVGDKAYRSGGGAPEPALRGMLESFPRQALHAFRLELDHPRTGDRLALEAPLPQDMAELLAALRRATRPDRV